MPREYDAAVIPPRILVRGAVLLAGALSVTACTASANGQASGGVDFFSLLWIFFIVSSLVPLLRKSMLDQQRQFLFRRIQRERGSRVITLIHRQETLSFLGFPVYRYIDIDDSEALLRAIHLTDEKVPIDLIMHTPGGLVLAAEQIARALIDHKGKVTVFVPHYAMSGGTLIALSADEIVMDRHAVLGPVDPQLGNMPAASILRVLELKEPKDIDDETLIKADIAKKALAQVLDTVVDLVSERMSAEDARKLAEALATGRWTHDYPIRVSQARELGLPVSTEMPDSIYALMALYPQASQRRPSVDFVPEPTVPTPRTPLRERRGARRN
jgi:ClpP class serine protease